MLGVMVEDDIRRLSAIGKRNASQFMLGNISKSAVINPAEIYSASFVTLKSQWLAQNTRYVTPSGI